MTLRVLVTGEHALYRAALLALLGQHGVNGATGSPITEFGDAALRHQPDLVVIALDSDADNIKTVDMISDLRRRLPMCRFMLILSPTHRALLHHAFRQRPEGMVDRDADPAYLIETVRAVSRGERRIHPDISAAGLHFDANPLTDREHEVLTYAADGGSASEIARSLELATGTVRNYLSRVVMKTGARSRIDAVRIARNRGWI
jgi:two-component system response regulator DesR